MVTKEEINTGLEIYAHIHTIKESGEGTLYKLNIECRDVATSTVTPRPRNTWESRVREREREREFSSWL